MSETSAQILHLSLATSTKVCYHWYAGENRRHSEIFDDYLAQPSVRPVVPAMSAKMRDPMSANTSRTLASYGIDYPGYQELAVGNRRREAIERWPLLSATDKLIAQSRWSRRKADEPTGELVLPHPPRNVSQIADARARSIGPRTDWYLSPKSGNSSG